MRDECCPSRRAFLQLAAAGPLVSVAAAQPPARSKMKVGCLSWCFHNFAPGTNPEPAIETIGGLGFDGIELIATAREDFQGLWGDTNLDRIRRKLADAKLEVSQFVLFQPVVEGLTSHQPDERKRNLDFFEAGCKVAAKLQAPMINIVAPWSRAFTGRGYLPRYYDLEQPKPGEKFHFDIAKGFDWDAAWSTFVQTIRDCVERAKQHGLRLSIEHHTHTMIPDAVSFLRLWDQIRDDALGYNLDTGWTLSQREYPPVAIHKVRKQLLNVHVRDIDGLMRRFVHFGEGVMDFPHIIETLKEANYTGYLSLEQDKFPGDMHATCNRFLKTMRELIG